MTRRPSHDPKPPTEDPADCLRSGRARVRWISALVLLALTLAGGWAAGRTGATAPAAEGLRAFGSPASGPVTFRGQLDRGSVLHDGDGLVRMELLLSADETDAAPSSTLPTDLVVVLDRSGSMRGKPLSDALASTRQLIDQLGPDDRFALVAYASDAGLVVPLQRASATNRAAWREVLGQIAAGGGTNMSRGMDLAESTLADAERAGRAPRMLLLSDGHANQGDHSLSGLRSRAARAVTGEYVLSTVGVGLDFDETLMAALADAGTGNFYYVEDATDLGDVFAGEFASARETVAQAVAVEIDLGPGVELVDAAGYPVERSGRRARFRPGSLFSGQERHIWLTLRAPTAALGPIELGDFELRYQPAGAAPGTPSTTIGFAEPPRIACVAGEEEYAASFDRELALRGINEDKLGLLKRQLSASVAEGSFDAAARQIERYRVENGALYRVLGLEQKDTASFAASAALEESLRRAAEAPAAAARKSLAKQLSAQGQDDRRQGAKK